jgi:hypothetical protein
MNHTARCVSRDRLTALQRTPGYPYGSAAEVRTARTLLMRLRSLVGACCHSRQVSAVGVHHGQRMARQPTSSMALPLEVRAPDLVWFIRPETRACLPNPLHPKLLRHQPTRAASRPGCPPQLLAARRMLTTRSSTLSEGLVHTRRGARDRCSGSPVPHSRHRSMSLWLSVRKTPQTPHRSATLLPSALHSRMKPFFSSIPDRTGILGSFQSRFDSFACQRCSWRVADNVLGEYPPESPCRA